MKEKKNWNIGSGGQLPIGFGLNLAANEKAMAVFSAMSEEEKEQTVMESRQQHSKEQMEQFVNRLGEREGFR